MTYKRYSVCAVLMAFLAACGANPVAANSVLNEGISKHDAGHYSEALELFGAAESAEFNNPVLHYYIADSHNRLRHVSDAIREYRIARSLQPKGTLADYCDRALRALGAEPPLAMAAASPSPLKANAKTSSALDGRLSEEETQRKEKLQDLQKFADKEIEDLNKRTQSAKADLRNNVGQYIAISHSQSIPNPDFQTAMEAIELDAVNKTNEINIRLKRNIDDANSLYDQRERAYQTSNEKVSLNPYESPSSGSGHVAATAAHATAPGAYSAAYDKSTAKSTALAANTAALVPTFPAVHTPLGLLPLLNQSRTKGSQSEILYVRVDSDGSWEKDGAEKQTWKEELVEHEDSKLAWQNWQLGLAKSMFAVLCNYDSREQHNPTGGIVVRLTVSRNGEILQADPFTGNAGPDSCSTENTKKFLSSPVFQAAKNDGQPALPSGSHFSKAYVLVFVSDNPEAWWRLH